MDVADPRQPQVTKIKSIGSEPYDALVTPDGRYYIAGLFGEDGLALVDLWHPRARRAPHPRGLRPRRARRCRCTRCRTCAAGRSPGATLFLPAIGRHEVLVVDRGTGREVGAHPGARPAGVRDGAARRAARVGQLRAAAQRHRAGDRRGRRALLETLAPGRAVLHLEFTPRGEQVWISARDDDRVVVYDTATFDAIAELAGREPERHLLHVAGGEDRDVEKKRSQRPQRTQRNDVKGDLEV